MNGYNLKHKQFRNELIEQKGKGEEKNGNKRNGKINKQFHIKVRRYYGDPGSIGWYGISHHSTA